MICFMIRYSSFFGSVKTQLCLLMHKKRWKFQNSTKPWVKDEADGMMKWSLGIIICFGGFKGTEEWITVRRSTCRCRRSDFADGKGIPTSTNLG